MPESFCGSRKQCATEGGCPFAFTDLSEKIQNYGCLPEPMDIVYMRQEHGKTWACHDDPTKPCAGALMWMKKEGLPFKVIDPILVTEEDDWNQYLKPIGE